VKSLNEPLQNFPVCTLEAAASAHVPVNICRPLCVYCSSYCGTKLLTLTTKPGQTTQPSILHG